MLALYLRSLLSDPAMADDVFQETMIVAWQKIDQYDRSRPFGLWLRGIARRLTLASRRQNSRFPAVFQKEALDQLDLRWTQLQASPGDNLQDKIAGLQYCMEQLPEKLRDTIELRYSKGIKGQRLADRLQLSLENVKKRMQRGREALMNCMQRHLDSEEGVTL